MSDKLELARLRENERQREDMHLSSGLSPTEVLALLDALAAKDAEFEAEKKRVLLTFDVLREVGRKELAAKDEQIAALRERLAKLRAAGVVFQPDIGLWQLTEAHLRKTG